MSPRTVVVEVWRAIRALPPRHVLLLGYLVLVVYGFPGYMSTDSVDQLAEARSGVLGSAHPPIMAKEWGLLDAIVAGPLLMLLLQGAVFLGGLYRIFRRVLEPRHAAWTSIALLLYPPVMTTMAVIWKDSQMAAYLVVGIAALLHPRLGYRLLGLGLMIVACAFRHNAFAAVVPLVFFVFEWRGGMKWWKRVLVMGVVAIASVALAFGITRVLAINHARMTPAISDIAGIIAFSEDRSDEELKQLLRGTNLAVETGIQERARTLYKLGGPYRLVVGKDRLFDHPRTEQDWEEIGRVHRELLVDNFGAYLASHWFLFERVIGLDELPRASVWNGFLEVPTQVSKIDHQATHSWAQLLIARVCAFFADETPLFRPYIYALIALLLIATCCRDRLTFALFTSGMLFELTYFVANADPDYRYSHWMITSTCIATVLLFIERRKRAS